MNIKKCGRKHGSGSFAFITLQELNRVLKDGAVVVIGKKFADMNHLQTLSIHGNATRAAQLSAPAPTIKIYDNIE